MSKRIKHYTNEFKEEAVKLALSSVSVREAAISLGISMSALHGWVAKAKNSGQQAIISNEGVINHINVKEVLEENKRLKQQLARLEQEKAILKKAATYFAKELG